MSKPGDPTPDPNPDPPAGDPPKADPPAGEPPKADPPADDPPKKDPSGKTFTQAELDRRLEKEKKDWEKKVKEAEARAKLSEDEKLKADNDGLRSQLRMRDAKDDVMEALQKAGARSPGLLFNSVKGDLEFDEKTGKLTNLKDLLKDLQADYADQFGTPKPDGTIDGGAGQQSGQTKLTKEALAAMTPDEINKLDWEEVKKVMAAK